MADSTLLSELIKRAAAENASLVDPQPAAQPNKSGVSTLAKLLYAGGAGADIGSTLYGFSRGHGEGNPLINWAGDKAAIPIGAGMELGGMYLLKKLLGDKHPRVLNMLLGGAGIAHGAIAGNNLRKFHNYANRPIEGGGRSDTPVVGNVGDLIRNK